MPEIRQYQAQVEPTGPVSRQEATGQEFGAGVGQAVEGLGNQIQQTGQVVADIAKQQDVATMNVNLAKAKNALGLQYADELQKGTLNHDKFMSSVNDAMDNVEDNVSTVYGQQRFNQLKANTQLEFSLQAQHGEAQLVGEQAVQNLKSWIDNSSSALHNNPNAFQNTLQQGYQYIDDLVANKGLPAEKAQELKTSVLMPELAKNAVRGELALNPLQGKLNLAQGKWDAYMNGDTKYRMEMEANTYEKAGEVEDARRKKAAQDAMDAAQEATKSKMLSQLYTNGLGTDQILKDPTLDFAAKKEMIAMVEKRQGDKVTTDNSTTRMLFNQIHMDPTDPNKFITKQDDLNKYYINGTINNEALMHLRGEFTGKGTTEGDANAKLSKAFESMAFNQIAKPDPVTHLPDPQGAQNYNLWLNDYMAKKQAALQAGKKITDLTDPKSPDYLGNNFSAYQRTPEQIVSDMANKMKQGQNPTPPQAVPGQTPLATPPPTDMVTVKDQNGNLYKAPKANLDKLKARGFKVQ